MHTAPSLSLVSDLGGLVVFTKLHARGGFLGRNGTRLGLVLNEGNTTATRNKTDFLEAFKAAKDGRERLDIVSIGQVLHEESLVGREVFVRNDTSCTTGRLETSTASLLGRPLGLRGGAGSRTLELLLLLLGLEGLLPLWSRCKQSTRQTRRM